MISECASTSFCVQGYKCNSIRVANDRKRIWEYGQDMYRRQDRTSQANRKSKRTTTSVGRTCSAGLEHTQATAEGA